MAEPIPYIEHLHVETWVDQANSQDRLSESIVNGLERREVSHGQILVDMIQGYANGREEFQGPRIAAAFALAEEKPAEAVVAAKLALNIPNRSGQIGIYQRNELIVAMNMRGPLKRLPGPCDLSGDPEDEYQQAYWKQVRLAEQAAFGTPENIEQDLNDIIDRSRERIADDEIGVWTTAINVMGEQGDLHGAAQGAIELGAAYGRRGDVHEAVLTYGAACSILKARLAKIIAEQEPLQRAAEMDELILSLRFTQRNVARLLSEKRRVKGVERELLKVAVYDFDDFGAPQEAVVGGYRLLAKSSRSPWQKFFFRREAREIAGDIAFWKHEGAVLNGPEERKGHTHLRPKVKLPV